MSKNFFCQNKNFRLFQYAARLFKHAREILAVDENRGVVIKRLVFVVLLFISMSATFSAKAADLQTKQSFYFSIPQQLVVHSIRQVAEQANITLIFPFEAIQSKTANAIDGNYTVEEALEHLLHGTGYKVAKRNNGHMSIVLAKNPYGGIDVMYKLNKIAATILGVTVATSAAISVPQAVADEAKSSFLEEVVVTAQKRAQSIQDVGIAVTAFSGDQMKAANFTNAGDVIAQVPNAVARRHFPSRGLTTNMFIRGVGQTGFADGDESSVASFIDEFYMIAASQSDFSTYDMERVEVLRGPQGTVFGRNATAGAVQSVTRRPNEELGGAIEIGFGNFGSQLIDGHINVPLSDKAQMRFSGVVDKHDPYVKNIFPGQPDILDQDFQAGRVQLRLLPSENLDINLKYETGKTEGRLMGDQAIIYQGTADGDIIEVAENGSGFNPVTAGVAGGDVTSEDNLNFGSNEIDHLLAKVEWQGDNVTFTSLTGWLEQDFLLLEDCDSTPNPTCAFSPDVNSKHWSQEFRLNGEAGKLTWTAGAYYLNQEATNDVVLGIFLTDPGSAAPSATYLDFNWDLEVESLALFGQLEYELSDTLTLTTGLRWNKDEKHFEQIGRSIGVTLPAGTTSFTTPELFRPDTAGTITSVGEIHTFTDEVAGDLTTQDDTNFSGTLQLDYRPNDNLLVYGSFRRGLKAAGFNNSLVTAITQADIELFPFNEEILHAYELGWKWDFEGKMPGRLNGAFYYYDYEDFQATQYIRIGNVISNNDATISGAELELQLSPAEGWFASFGAGFIFDTEIEDVTRVSFTGPETFTADRELAEAPELSLNGLLRYEWSAANGDWGAQIDASYTGERFLDVLNQSALTLDSFVEANASLSYRHESNGFSARLWVRNLADDRTPTHKLAAPGLDLLGQLNWNQPRTYGVVFGYDF